MIFLSLGKPSEKFMVQTLAFGVQNPLYPNFYSLFRYIFDRQIKLDFFVFFEILTWSNAKNTLVHGYMEIGM